MTYQSLDDLLKERVFYHFSEISNIPRGSYMEKDISDFIAKWAVQQGLSVQQDEKYNVIINKPASAGFEDKQPIVLQAHLDMVCEKSEGVVHDFTKDGIHLQLEGDLLLTGNRTTLGADDGIGIALCMTILEDNTLYHPAIDVLLTTAEEEDMSGALHVDPTWFQTNRVINLDHIVDNEMVVGSSGGKATKVTLPLNYVPAMPNYVTYSLVVNGLIGGHSGEDIHRGRANANVLLTRLLYQLCEQTRCYIGEIKGGSFRLAIPREARAILNVHPEDIEIIQKIVDNFKDSVRTIYTIEEQLQVQLVPTEKFAISDVWDKTDTLKILQGLLLLPNGISEMLGAVGMVESSCNIGEIYVENRQLCLVTEIRATYEEQREYLYSQFEIVAQCLGGAVVDFAAYPSWHFQSESALRTVAENVYSKLYKEPISTIVVHAGLECGCFAEKIPDMDAISIGPNIWDLHSPKERLSVSSTQKVYEFLVKLLAELP